MNITGAHNLGDSTSLAPNVSSGHEFNIRDIQICVRTFCCRKRDCSNAQRHDEDPISEHSATHGKSRDSRDETNKNSCPHR